MKRKTLLFWLSGVTLIGSTCANLHPLAIQKPLWRQQQGGAIREQFFRHQMLLNPSRFYFLQVGGKSPNVAFMARFHDLPNVKPVAAMKLVDTVHFGGKPIFIQGRDGRADEIRHIGGSVIGKPADKKTGVRGNLLKLDRMHWLADTSVVVTGCQDDGGEMSINDTFTLGYQNGHWQIVDDVEQRASFF